MKRLENGLVEGIDYKYENGRINWRAMVPKEFLYINVQHKDRLEKRLNKKFEDITVEEVDDKELILLLGGIRYLMELRGINSLYSSIFSASQDYAAVNCQIEFIPNLENPTGLTYSDNACAHLNNTRNFAQQYLIEMASNRAMCRVVRAALRISVVSKEELLEGLDESNGNSDQNSFGPYQTIERLMSEKKKTFEDLKEKLITSGDEEANSYTKLKDIPPAKIFKLIEKLKKVKPATE